MLVVLAMALVPCGKRVALQEVSVEEHQTYGEAEVVVLPTITKETASLLGQLLVFYDRLADQDHDDVELRLQGNDVLDPTGEP